MTRKLLSDKRTRQTIRSWLPMLLILLLFITPLFLATYIKERKSLFELGTTNRGHLLTPATSLAGFKFTTAAGGDLSLSLLQNKWGLIYIAPQACQETCIENIYKIQQLKDAIRIKNPNFYTMVITNPHDTKTNPVYALIRQHYPTTLYVVMNKSELTQLFQSLPTGTQNNNIELLYIVDPKGYLVMSYPPGEAGQAILRDLKTLVKG